MLIRLLTFVTVAVSVVGITRLAGMSASLPRSIRPATRSWRGARMNQDVIALNRAEYRVAADPSADTVRAATAVTDGEPQDAHRAPRAGAGGGRSGRSRDAGPGSRRSTRSHDGPAGEDAAEPCLRLGPRSGALGNAAFQFLLAVSHLLAGGALMIRRGLPSGPRKTSTRMATQRTGPSGRTMRNSNAKIPPLSQALPLAAVIRSRSSGCTRASHSAAGRTRSR